MMAEREASIEKWFFYEGIAGLWKWAKLDLFGTVLDYSRCAFATRDECVNDARRNGYASDQSAVPVNAPASAVRARASRAPGATRGRRSSRSHTTRI